MASSMVSHTLNTASRPVISNTFKIRGSVHTNEKRPPWVRTRLRPLMSTPRPVESMKSTASEVDHDVVALVVDQGDELLAQAGSGGHVDLATHLDDRPVASLADLES